MIDEELAGGAVGVVGSGHRECAAFILEAVFGFVNNWLDGWFFASYQG